jgi:hypothetical protein
VTEGPAEEPRRRFALGRAAATVVAALKRRWLGYLLAGLVAGAGLPILANLGFEALRGLFAWARDPGFVLASSLIRLALGALLTGLVIQLTLQAVQPRPEAPAGAIGAAIERLPALFVVTVLMRLPNLLITVPTAYIYQGVQSGGVGASESAARIMMLSGPAIVIGTILSLLVIVPKQVVMAEAAGPIAAIRRSWALTRGRRWKVGALVFAVMSVTGLVELAVILWRNTLIASGVAAWVQTGSLYLSLPTGILGTVVATAVYMELRRLEGGGAARTAAVFD